MGLILFFDVWVLRDCLIAVVAKAIELLLGMVDKCVKDGFERLIVFGAIEIHLIAVTRIVVLSELLD